MYKVINMKLQTGKGKNKLDEKEGRGALWALCLSISKLLIYNVHAGLQERHPSSHALQENTHFSMKVLIVTSGRVVVDHFFLLFMGVRCVIVAFIAVSGGSAPRHLAGFVGR